MVEQIAEGLVNSLVSVGDLIGEWFGQHAVNIVAILIGAWLVRKFGVGLIGRLLKHTVRPDLYPTKADREKRVKTLNSLVGAAIRFGVYVIAGIMLIGEINPSYTTALFTSAGLIGAAIGFGAKDIINDFVSGIFIITENQYRVGDIIEASGVDGIVIDITIRTTVIRDLDGQVHHIPNGKIGVTTNKSLGFSQVNEDIEVAFDTDISRLEHVINHVGEELASDPELKSKIIKAPYFEYIVRFGKNGVIVKVLAKTTPGDQWLVKGAFYKRLKIAFEKNDIEVPYRQVVIHDKKFAKK